MYEGGRNSTEFEMKNVKSCMTMQNIVYIEFNTYDVHVDSVVLKPTSCSKE